MRLAVRYGSSLFWKPLREVRQWHQLVFHVSVYLLLLVIVPEHVAMSWPNSQADRHWAESFFRTSMGNSTWAMAGGGTTSSLYDQCLVFHSNLSQEVCAASVSERVEKVRKYQFSFCNNFPIWHVIEPDRSTLEGSEQECQQYLNSLSSKDRTAQCRFSFFKDIISRFDCKGNFSTHWKCEDCMVSQL